MATLEPRALDGFVELGGVGCRGRKSGGVDFLELGEEEGVLGE